MSEGPGRSTPSRALGRALAAQLAEYEAAGLRRRLHLPGGVDLTSNDVLDFARDPWLVEAVVAAVRAHGVGGGASRLLRGHTQQLEALEARLAEWSGREAALVFPSGYQANMTVFRTLIGPGDTAFSDAANHASIIDGLRLSGARREIFAHGDLAALEAALTRAAEASPGARRLIAVESLYSMDGDRADLPAICALAERHGAVVVVDEAHATGLFGGRGSGLVEAAGLSDRVLFTLHTGGKALGVAGAWVAGDRALIEHLINFCRGFIYTTAPMVPLVAGLDAAMDLWARSRDRVARVHTFAARLRAALRGAGLDLGRAEDHVVPVIAGSTARAVSAAAALVQDGFDVRAIRPPTVPDGAARLRLTVRASLDEPTIDRLAARVIAAMAEGPP